MKNDHSNQQPGKDPSCTTKLTNRKFLSIKSILRNKKIIVKKSMLASVYAPATVSTTNFAPGHESITFSQLSCHSNTQNPTKVVEIKFDKVGYPLEKNQPGHSPHAQSQEQRLRRRIIANLMFEEQRKSDMLRQNSWNNDLSGSNFSQTLLIEPLMKIQQNRKERKNFTSQHHMTVVRRPRKSHQQSDALRTKRLISTSKSRHQSNNRRPHGQQQNKQNCYFLRNQETPPLMDADLCFDYVRGDGEEKKQEEKQREANEISLKEEFKQFLPIRKPAMKKDFFVFGMSGRPTCESENKIEIYRDFLWKVSYSNSLFVRTPENIDSSYRVYFGPGNNSCMLKAIMRRRFWWTIVDSSNKNIEDCQFVWTQLKINSLFGNQVAHQQPSFIPHNPGQYLKYSEIRQGDDRQEQMGYGMQLSRAHAEIFNYKDWKYLQDHIRKNPKSQQKITEQTYLKRLSLYGKKPINKISDSAKLRVHNHLEFNYFLGNKKALFYNLRRYHECQGLDPFQVIPLTYHISKGVDDPVYQSFLQHFNKLQNRKRIDKSFRNIWICKPGENSNRGNGISVCFGIDDIRLRLRGKEKNSDGKPRTFILQKYIQKPFLYKNRKFDIRHYILLTCINGVIKAYWFNEGYIRTSSSPFCLKDSKDVMVHLTNDAVQKKSQNYGKHEKGNKISYEQFQKYLNTHHKKKKLQFFTKTLKQMESIALSAVEATYSLLDPARKENNFELIGLDFMIDENFKPWLIEANTNPCLELSCPLLEKLIPNLIEQTFRLCIDPLFPPPESFMNKKQFFGEHPLLENKFRLIFDETVDGERVQNCLRSGSEDKSQDLTQLLGKIQEDDEEFADDGDEKWEENAN